jgi:pimeloyl-ACP methyl ester carboxylesterase
VDATAIDSRRLAGRARRPHTPAGSRREELDRASIRLRLDGRGARTLVFAPDGPNVLEHYDELTERLASRYAVLRFELPGFGFSYPRAGYGFTLEEQAGVAVETLERTGRAPYVLAFSCSNAYVALKVAADRPDLVERLVLIQAPSWTQEQRWARRIDPGGVMARPALGQLVNAAAPGRLARSWYGIALGEEGRRAHFQEPALAALRNGACFCLASLIQGSRRTARFAPVAQPTLALWGARDRTHRHSDGRSMLDHVPHAECLEFERSGHFPELEESERFAGALEQFLAAR